MVVRRWLLLAKVWPGNLGCHHRHRRSTLGLNCQASGSPGVPGSSHRRWSSWMQQPRLRRQCQWWHSRHPQWGLRYLTMLPVLTQRRERERWLRAWRRAKAKSGGKEASGARRWVKAASGATRRATGASLEMRSTERENLETTKVAKESGLMTKEARGRRLGGHGPRPMQSLSRKLIR